MLHVHVPAISLLHQRLLFSEKRFVRCFSMHTMVTWSSHIPMMNCGLWVVMEWIRGGGRVYISLPGSYFSLGKRWWDGPQSHSGCSNEDRCFKSRRPLWC